ncbi:HNH endonuclease signature motif containing protein [Microbacterium terrisoli]|uniref:HNH endonuclease signature motif containing protein n=1 Tax=Microbacterium terrisoli TaxID=3242192 RepID=UPI0028047782|nr:DUF222 domain-containing protein [Microbacterium protaetiae]
MHTAPADLITTLTRLDQTLAACAREAIDGDVSRGMTDAELVTLTRVTESLGRRVDAMRITSAGEIAERSRPERGEQRLSARQGCMNASDLLTRLTCIASASARGRIRHAHAVATRTTLTGTPLPAQFPAIRTALAAGTIGADTVAAIVSTLSPVADRCDPALLAAAERELVAAATDTSPDGAPPCSADDTRLQAKVWLLVLDPDGPVPDDERAARRRFLRLGRKHDDLVPISGALLPEVAAQLERLFDAYENPRVEDRTQDAGVAFRDRAGEHGDAQQADPRTRAQRRHDILATILGVAARSADSPTLGGLPPTLLVTIGADEVDRDGECIIPGCHIPASWCEIHHVVPYAEGGRTHVDNGVPLCWWHHRTIETSGWQIRMVGGVPEVRAPSTIDPNRRWRRHPGSLHRARDGIRRAFDGGAGRARSRARRTTPG